MAYSGNDDIVTLTASNGEEIDFVEIAGINYRGKFYAILQPVELLEGMSDDEALVFEVTRTNGRDNFNIELNDSIIDGVFKEYNRLLDKQKKGGKKLKKSGGVGKIFGAATAVARTTLWIVKLILSIALTLLGAFFVLGGILSRDGVGLIGMIILCGLGVLFLVLGGRCIAKVVKNRKH